MTQRCGLLFHSSAAPPKMHPAKCAHASQGGASMKSEGPGEGASCRPRVWYFEAVDCARKLAFGAVLLYFDPGTSTQIVAATFLAFAVVLAYALGEPMQTPQDQGFLVLQTQMLFVVIFIGALMNMSSEYEESLWLTIFLMAASISALLYPCYLICRGWMRRLMRTAPGRRLQTILRTTDLVHNKLVANPWKYTVDDRQDTFLLPGYALSKDPSLALDDKSAAKASPLYHNSELDEVVLNVSPLARPPAETPDGGLISTGEKKKKKKKKKTVHTPPSTAEGEASQSPSLMMAEQIPDGRSDSDLRIAMQAKPALSIELEGDDEQPQPVIRRTPSDHAMQPQGSPLGEIARAPSGGSSREIGLDSPIEQDGSNVSLRHREKIKKIKQRMKVSTPTSRDGDSPSGSFGRRTPPLTSPDTPDSRNKFGGDGDVDHAGTSLAGRSTPPPTSPDTPGSRDKFDSHELGNEDDEETIRKFEEEELF
eukprot:gene16190-19213_t